MKRSKLFSHNHKKTGSRRAKRKNGSELSFETLEPRKLLAADFAPVIDFDIATDWAGIHDTGGATDRGYNIVIQPDEKIVVTGVIAKTALQSSQDFLVARYNADGTIDTGFGLNGKGYNLVDFSDSGPDLRDIGGSVALQADGKIVASGISFNQANGVNTLTAARFNSDGTFDVKQSVQPFIEQGGNLQSGGKLRVLASGKILILGTVTTGQGADNDLLLTRLNTDFTLDTSFGDNGMLLFDFQGLGLANSANGMAEQSDGKIVVAGGVNGQGYYARFHADGTLDTSYASNGVGVLDTSANGANGLGQVVLDANDNAYFATTSDISVDGSDTEIVIVKMDNTGSLDTGFGNGGIFRFDMTSGKEFDARMSMDQTGKLIVVGRTDGISGQNNFMIRVASDGTIDNGFGTFLLGGDRLRGAAAVDASNRPVITGEIVQSSTDLRLVRVNPNVKFADSFENGQWDRLWLEDSQNDWFTSAQRSTDGSFSAEVDGNASGATLTVANPIDLRAYGSAELRFDWLIESGFDGGEYLALDFLDKDGNWDLIANLEGNIDPENVWHDETIQITDSQYLHSDFQFRYRAKVNRSNEDANVDNVALVGTSLAGPPNANPIANDDSYNVDEDSSLNVAAPGVLGNDTDAEDNPLTAILDSGTSNGSLTLNPDGSFIYTPNLDFNGSDSFTYVADDGFGTSNLATVSITVNPIADAPHATADNYGTDQDTPLTVAAPGVLSNDGDADGDLISAVLVTGPSNALVFNLNSDGSFSYTPNPGFLGSDSYTYYATDEMLNSNTVTVMIDVTAVASTLVKTNTTSQAIPDQSTITSVISNSESFNILDLNVQVDITHTSDADLDVFLIAPDGTRIELFTDVGGGGDNFSGTILDDEAVTAISDGSAPFSGTYRPEGNLAVVDGLNTFGDWTLEITDDKRRRTGTLNSWTLMFEVASGSRGTGSNDDTSESNDWVELSSYHLPNFTQLNVVDDTRQDDHAVNFVSKISAHSDSETVPFNYGLLSSLYFVDLDWTFSKLGDQANRLMDSIDFRSQSEMESIDRLFEVWDDQAFSDGLLQ